MSRSSSYLRAIASAIATVMEIVAKARRSATPPPLTQWIVTFMGRDRVYDITRARTHLQYQPTITVDEGLRRMTALER